MVILHRCLYVYHGAKAQLVGPQHSRAAEVGRSPSPMEAAPSVSSGTRPADSAATF